MLNITYPVCCLEEIINNDKTQEARTFIITTALFIYHTSKHISVLKSLLLNNRPRKRMMWLIPLDKSWIWFTHSHVSGIVCDGLFDVTPIVYKSKLSLKDAALWVREVPKSLFYQVIKLLRTVIFRWLSKAKSAFGFICSQEEFEYKNRALPVKKFPLKRLPPVNVIMGLVSLLDLSNNTLFYMICRPRFVLISVE